MKERVSADYRTSLAGPADEREQQKSLCHLRSAQKLVQLCFTNGGIYIKLGQVAAQMVSFSEALEQICPAFQASCTLTNAQD